MSIVKFLYRIIHNIFNKLFKFKFLDLNEEKKYLIYNEIFDYSNVDISNIDVRWRDNYKFLAKWRNDSYIMHYPYNCWIEPIYGYAITINKKYLLHSKPNSYRPYLFGSKWGSSPPPDRFVFEFKKCKSVNLGSCISLNYQENFGRNYFFAFDQVLGQLWLLKQNGVDLSLPIIIPKSFYYTKFFNQIISLNAHLSKLNFICRDDINYDLRNAKYFYCKEIFTARTNCYSKVHLIPVLSLFNNIKPCDSNVSKKFFLNRSSARSRHLSNSLEIENIVKQFGFEVIDTDNLSFLDQISIFRNASYLIALHGAGNVNMIFRYPQKMKFLEIHTPDWPGAGYVIVASEMGFEYDVFWGSKLDKDKSFYIEPNSFKEKIKIWIDN